MSKAEAMIHAQNLLRSDPDHVEGRLLRARIALAMDDGAIAERDYLRAQQLGVDQAEVIVQLGEALKKQEAFGRIIADIHTRATNNEADRNAVALLRGDAYLALGRIENAENSFRQVASDNPNSADAVVATYSKAHSMSIRKTLAQRCCLVSSKFKKKTLTKQRACSAEYLRSNPTACRRSHYW